MEDTSVESQPLDSGDSAYPKPPDWESLSHGQRYAALTQEPRPESTAAQNALLHAKQSELRAMNLERKAAIAEREAPLLAAAPRFSIKLDAPRLLSLSRPAYTFIASIRYDADPAGGERSVVFDLSHGPLNPSSPQMKSYSLYTGADCLPENLVPRLRPNASMRQTRDPDGRLTTHFEVTSLTNYIEMEPGQSVSKEVLLELDERSGWRQHLTVGREYWLRCDHGGLSLDRYWQYGKLADLKPPFKKLIRDPNAVAIPLEASNTARFEVVS